MALLSRESCCPISPAATHFFSCSYQPCNRHHHVLRSTRCHHHSIHRYLRTTNRLTNNDHHSLQFRIRRMHDLLHPQHPDPTWVFDHRRYSWWTNPREYQSRNITARGRDHHRRSVQFDSLLYWVSYGTLLREICMDGQFLLP